MKERSVLGFEALGGAVAWLFHLMSVYAIGEFGCVLEGVAFQFLGLSAVTWSLIAVTLLALAASGSATWIAWKNRRAPATASPVPLEGSTFLARAGWISNLLFSFVIVVEATPLLFLGKGC